MEMTTEIWTTVHRLVFILSFYWALVGPLCVYSMKHEMVHKRTYGKALI